MMDFTYFVREHVGKRFDGVDTLRWNLEVEPFVAQ
jgi:hypothetical protein